MVSIDVTDFQFRGLKKFRVCGGYAGLPEAVGRAAHCFIASSSKYGITAVATADKKLVSFRTSDIYSTPSSRSDSNAETRLGSPKISVLPLTETDDVISVAGNSSGRILSVFANTRSGPFVYLYDFCALSPEYKSEAGPVQSIRISASESAKGIALEWNPLAEGGFAATASDGTFSTFLIDLSSSNKLNIIGTVQLKLPGMCISWSPKGKQLVVGDARGTIFQYKPEMALVRHTLPPTDIPSMKGLQLQCSSICWLSTVEFLVAYSAPDHATVCASLLCARKEGPPQWTHFDDLLYCSGQCSFPQRVHFAPLLQWNLVLCASSRSSEVAVLGKRNGSWKCWTLDDYSRIEMPLSPSHEESFPMGICFDLSSQVPVKLGDDARANSMICPTVFVVTSHGLVLAYSALSLDPAHQNINSAPLGLSSAVYAGVPPAVPSVTPPQLVQLAAPAMPSTTAFAKPNVAVAVPSLFAKAEPAAQVTKAPQQSVAVSKSLEIASSPVSTLPKVSQPPQVLSTQVTKESQAASVSAEIAKKEAEDLLARKEEEELVKLRSDLKFKLSLFDKEIVSLREVNDWMRDLKCSVERNISSQTYNGYKVEEEEINAVRKLSCEVDLWLRKVKCEMSELKLALEEQQKTAQCQGKENIRPVSMKMLDFNNRFRLGKLNESFRKLEEKVSRAEKLVEHLSTDDAPKHFTAAGDFAMTPDEEHKLCIAVKSVCKSTAVRRKVLSDLYQQFADLEFRFRKGGRKADDSTPSRINANSTLVAPQPMQVQRITVEEQLYSASPCDFSCRRAKLIDFFAKRTMQEVTPRKPNVVFLEKSAVNKSFSTSEIDRLESRLIDAIASSHKKIQKKSMDIGTQSPAAFMKEESKKDSTQPALVKETKPVFSPLGSLFGAKPLSTVTEMAASTSGVAAAAATRPSSVSNFNLFQDKTAISVGSTSTTIGAPTAVSTAPPKGAVAPIPSKPVPTTSIAATSVSPQPLPKDAAVTTTKPEPSKGSLFGGLFGKSSPSVPAKAADSVQAKSDVPATSAADAKAVVTEPVSTTTSVAITSSPIVAAPEVPKTLEKPATATSVPTAFGIPSTRVTTTSAPTAVTSVAPASATEAQPSVSFTFALPASTTAAPKPTLPGASMFSSNASSLASSTNPSQAAMDEGMEDDTATNTTSNLFSSAFSGLGTPTSTTMNPPKSIFGGGTTFGGSTASPASSSLFGSLGKQKTSGSVFGGAATAQTSSPFSSPLFGSASSSSGPTSSLFSSTLAQSQQQPQQQQQQTSTLFGAKPAVAGSSAFGAAPSFGSKPAFGGSPSFGSAFSQNRPAQASTPTSTGFSAFARGGSVGFGSLAAGQQSTGSSVFGGSGFGALASQAATKPSSVFGGGINTPSNSSFSSWR